VSVARLVPATLMLVLAVGLALFARDLLAANDAVERGDRQYAATPRVARWAADPWLPADPAGAALGVEQELELRRAVQSFVRAVDVPQGLDNGQTRARARAAAEVALARVTGSGDARAASQAANLVGVLAETETEGGTTTRGRAAFETAVRADPANRSAAYNLELILRRSRVVGTREGPGSGSGTRGPAERGAGSGLPGEGY
jgi:hypothetical protein